MLPTMPMKAIMILSSEMLKARLANRLGVMIGSPLAHQGNKHVGGLLWHYKDV